MGKTFFELSQRSKAHSRFLRLGRIFEAGIASRPGSSLPPSVRRSKWSRLQPPTFLSQPSIFEACFALVLPSGIAGSIWSSMPITTPQSCAGREGFGSSAAAWETGLPVMASNTKAIPKVAADRLVGKFIAGNLWKRPWSPGEKNQPRWLDRRRIPQGSATERRSPLGVPPRRGTLGRSRFPSRNRHPAAHSRRDRARSGRNRRARDIWPLRQSRNR